MVRALLGLLAIVPAAAANSYSYSYCERTGVSVVSGGAMNGDTASLEIQVDGVASAFDDSWMGRGFNVVVFGDEATLENPIHENFDLIEKWSEGYRMKVFLEGIAEGSLVVMTVKGGGYDHHKWGLMPYLTWYMKKYFGSIEFENLMHHDSYAFVGKKGSGGAAVQPDQEALKIEGDGLVELTTIPNCPTPAPTPQPTSEPTSLEPTIAPAPGTTFVIESGGYPDNSALLQLKNGPQGDGYDSSWMSRGFNVVVLEKELVTQSKTFDVYASASKSTEMKYFLEQDVEYGSIVVITVLDASNHWQHDHSSSELKTLMSAEFGATEFGNLGWRDSYVFVGVKGSSPLGEQRKDGSLASLRTHFETPCSLQAMFWADSAGYDDGNKASLSYMVGGEPKRYDDSNFGRGYNIVVLDPSTMEPVSTNNFGNFDLYDSAYKSDLMKAFINTIPAGSLVIIVAENAIDTWQSTSHRGDDLVTKMNNKFSTTMFGDLAFRDSYVMIGYKDGALLAETRSPARSGMVSEKLTDESQCS